MNEYKITITVEGSEEQEVIDFTIEANSLEEAVDSIRNDLDI